MKPFRTILAEYKRYVQGLGYREDTVREHVRIVSLFYNYLAGREKTGLYEATANDVTGYIRLLENSISKKYKRPYSLSTIRRKYSTIKSFFRYLYVCEYILVNPLEDTKPHFTGQGKRRGIFTLDEINTFLDSIDITKEYGQRDRAIFELMYSSALRTGETINLDITDIDLHARILLVREGKGGKDSYIPFSETALIFLQKYINEERKQFLKSLKGNDRQALFLSCNGRITNAVVQKRFRLILKNAHIPKIITPSGENRSPHSIRHSTATHLLGAGANVYFVSDLLRHENIETTVRYTHLPIEYLKRAYKSSHPRENDMYEDISDNYVKELENLTKELLQKNGCIVKMSQD